MVKNFIACFLIGMSIVLYPSTSLSEETEKTINPSHVLKTDDKTIKQDCSGFDRVKTEQGCRDRRHLIIEELHNCPCGQSPFSSRAGNWETRPPNDPTDPYSPIRIIKHVCGSI